MKRVLLFMIVGVGFITANCQQAGSTNEETSNEKEATGKIELIEVAELKELLSTNPDIQLVDVRTPKEYGDGTIETAGNVNFFDSDFGRQMLEATDKEQPIYIFCRTGRRSANAAKKLKTLGFKDIYDLKGGYLAWSAAEN